LDFTLSRDLLRQRAFVRQSKEMLRSRDLRLERESALAYTLRVIAEFKGRGVIPDDPKLADWADQLREVSLGASKDFLAGTRTIAELNDESLRMLGTSAAVRERYTAYLVDLLSAENPFSFLTWSEHGVADQRRTRSHA
jgi:hypothetical protein